MRFDDVKMTPLFMLEIGKPGSSFALEIARKTGLPEDTLKEAERLVGNELAGFEKLVRSLERERVELTERVKQLEVQEVELKNTLSKYKTLSSELESKKKDIIEKAKTEAQQLLKNTNREIEKTIRHIRENNAQKTETLKVRKNLNELSNKVKREERKSDQKENEPVQEGDRVRIIGQGGSGVVQVIKGKNAVVQFGEIKSVINLTKLEKIAAGEEKELPKRQSTGVNLNEKRAVFNSTLDIRGKRAEEVSGLLDQFMDTALLLGQGEIRILHGKGEGVLRKMVREHLKQYREVASIADEHVERGGDGISIVVLK
jgi:DNA mismatch repair protein MutS2